MADIVYNNTNHNPEMKIEVDFDTKRSGDKVTITATVKESFLDPIYSETGLYYGWTLTFSMNSGSVSNSVVIKDKNSWYAVDEKSRTKKCSITLTTTNSNASVSCQVTTSMSQYAAGTMPKQTKSVSLPTYKAPTAPTSISINPNPCNINSAPSIAWSGAKKGSLNVIYYDLEIRATTSSGSWTSWSRLLTETSSTSYKSKTINQLVVSNQKPFVGIKYQYRVRSTDKKYSTSGWKVSGDLNISFVSPTAPNASSWDTNNMKNKSLSLKWSGASGGSGSITKYEVDIRWYDKTTNQWSNWKDLYTGTTTTTTFNYETLFPDISNSDQLQCRIRTQNSWSQWSSYLTTSVVVIRANQLWIKVNGNWVQGSVYIKINNTWVEGMPYIKINNVWKESI